MTKQALVITTAGTHEVIEDISLKTLQAKVGGWVQAIDLDKDVTLWANEEGKLEGLPVNPFATALWELAFGVGTDIIVGDIVLTGGTDEEGETLGLQDFIIENLVKILEEA
jgi:hypothetical protein